MSQVVDFKIMPSARGAPGKIPWTGQDYARDRDYLVSP
jgi:hypothetical protein